MPDVRITTRTGVRTFAGTSIAVTTTGRDPRWGEFEIWKLDDGTGYATYVAGMSRVYHRRDTTCTRINKAQSGELMSTDTMLAVCGRVTDKPPVPCPRCHPPAVDKLRPSEEVRYEAPNEAADVYPDFTEVIRGLTTLKYRQAGGPEHTGVKVSKPVADLLEQARRNDPDAAAAPVPVTPLVVGSQTG